MEERYTTRWWSHRQDIFDFFLLTGMGCAAALVQGGQVENMTIRDGFREGGLSIDLVMSIRYDVDRIAPPGIAARKISLR
jgi:hypothetical protein